MGNPPTEELKDRTPETTLTVTATVQLEELSEDEEQERHRLESKVERAFYESGSALREIRSRRLYRVTHPADFLALHIHIKTYNRERRV